LNYPKEEIAGVVLAGGRATRMGGEDKGLLGIAGRPMVEYVAERLRGQSGAVLVNANRNLERYRELCGCPVVEDIVGDFAGPLAGMASAMRFAQSRYILTAPCDSPLVSPTLGRRLFAALEKDDSEIAVAHDGERMQPVFALLRCDLIESMLAYLESGQSKIDRWYAKHRTALGDFSDEPSMFLNINTAAELAELEERLLEARAS
jgi:molybdenum cofactor guanylyltransferase